MGLFRNDDAKARSLEWEERLNRSEAMIERAKLQAEIHKLNDRLSRVEAHLGIGENVCEFCGVAYIGNFGGAVEHAKECEPLRTWMTHRLALARARRGEGE